MHRRAKRPHIYAQEGRKASYLCTRGLKGIKLMNKAEFVLWFVHQGPKFCLSLDCGEGGSMPQLHIEGGIG